jgi:hypothetical protein
MSIPTDHHKLVELLERASPQRYEEIRTALLTENPQNRPAVERAFDLADCEVMHNARVAAARSDLHEELRQVELRTTYALTHLNELRVSLKDSEYAGLDGADLDALLNKLRRDAHLASVLNRHILRFDDPEYAAGGVQ